MKRFIAFIATILCVTLVATLCVACAPKGIKEWESYEIVNDNNPYYKDYYHIFVYSFADSNADGIGDLKGIEQKLDYIANLGFTGIWLSPINPSPTYHKYDVTDYYDIDKVFGSLEDFKSLVNAAHDKGISIMMDLVINHSSNKHPWFVASQKAYREKDSSNKYYDFYTFKSSDASLYYTFENYSHMPKLNLESDGVRAELDKMCKFWLQDYGVDGFRLDAAYHFFNGNATKNIEFMQWFMSTAKKYNPDVYMVGEVYEHDTVVYSHYAENSVQSFFNFELSGTKGYNKLFVILNSGVSDQATKLKTVVTAKEKGTAKGIDALFASNHDTSRVSSFPLSYYSSRDSEVTESLMAKHKMGIALLYTQSGNVFNYYGNEIGMRNGIRYISGTDYEDQTYRIAMNWGNDYVESQEQGFAYSAYGGNTRFGEYDDYLGGVAEQIDDQNSLYNFYRRVMLLRRQNPEIARGKSTFVAYEDESVAVVVREYNGSKILLVYNLNAEENKTVDLSKIVTDNGLQGTLAGFLSSDNGKDVTLSGSNLKMPAFSVAVIH